MQGKPAHLFGKEEKERAQGFLPLSFMFRVARAVWTPLRDRAFQGSQARGERCPPKWDFRSKIKYFGSATLAAGPRYSRTPSLLRGFEERGE